MKKENQINILVIEDDEFSLQALCEIIERFLNKKVTGAFSTAEEAIPFLTENQVDLIFTDIKLPGMDGLEFSKLVSEIYPDIPIVIISAFGDFEYARRAINTNIVSYILKPVNYDSLSDAVNVAIEAINKSQKTSFIEEIDAERMRLFFLRYFDTSKKNTNVFNSENIPEIYKNLKLNLFFVEILDYKTYIQTMWSYGKERLLAAINNILNSFNSTSLKLFATNLYEGTFEVFLISSKENDFDFSLIEAALKKLLALECKHSYSYTLLSLEKHDDNCSLYLMNKIIHYLLCQTQPPEELIKLLNHDTDIFILIKKVSSVMLNKIGVKGLSDEIDIFEYQQISNYVHAFDYFKKQYYTISKLKQCESSSTIDMAIKFISHNYMKNISLDDVSSAIGYSSKYFSKYFKSYMGIGFSEYLDNYRIKKACEIMKEQPNIKFLAVSSKVGYENSSTFYKNFKRRTGMTPKEYIKSNIS